MRRRVPYTANNNIGIGIMLVGEYVAIVDDPIEILAAGFEDFQPFVWIVVANVTTKRKDIFGTFLVSDLAYVERAEHSASYASVA